MTSSTLEPANRPDTRAVFATTHWTIVLAAGGSTTVQARLALEDLCGAYWRPIYAFVRRLGHSPHDAQDLTQEFFARLLASGSLDRVSPAKGRFRSFLLAALKHFLANEWDKARCLKRGGGIKVVSLDPVEGESAEHLEESGDPGPEKAFDRQWAMALLDRVLSRLKEEHRTEGKARIFEQLKETLTCDRHTLPYATIGAGLGLSEGAVKVSVHRLRQRYRELLREEIAHTVVDATQIEEELKDLFAALGN